MVIIFYISLEDKTTALVTSLSHFILHSHIQDYVTKCFLYGISNYLFAVPTTPQRLQNIHVI